MEASEIMNTPAMRMAYTLVIVYMIARPKTTTRYYSVDRGMA